MSRGVRNSQPDPHVALALRSPSGGPGHPYLLSLSPTPKPNQEGQAIARCANDTARLQAQWPRQCWAGNCTASVVGCLLAHQVSPNPNPNPNPTPNPTPNPNPKPSPTLGMGAEFFDDLYAKIAARRTVLTWLGLGLGSGLGLG